MTGAMKPLGSLVLLGLPGLLLGAGIGGLVRRWALLLAVAALGLAVFAYGISHVPDGPDDDDPGVLVALAWFTNLAGWFIGLAVGFGVRRSFRRSPW
jgi:hypothetical protein